MQHSMAAEGYKEPVLEAALVPAASAAAAFAGNMAVDSTAAEGYTVPEPKVHRAFDNIPAAVAGNTPAAESVPVAAFAVEPAVAAPGPVVASAAAALVPATFAAAALAVAALAVAEPGPVAPAVRNSYCNSDLTSKFLLLPVFSRLIVYLVRVYIFCNEV